MQNDTRSSTDIMYNRINFDGYPALHLDHA